MVIHIYFYSGAEPLEVASHRLVFGDLVGCAPSQAQGRAGLIDLGEHPLPDDWQQRVEQLRADGPPTPSAPPPSTTEDAQ